LHLVGILFPQSKNDTNKWTNYSISRGFKHISLGSADCHFLPMSGFRYQLPTYALQRTVELMLPLHGRGSLMSRML
jgi:hypothetical protein